MSVGLFLVFFLAILGRWDIKKGKKKELKTQKFGASSFCFIPGIRVSESYYQVEGPRKEDEVLYSYDISAKLFK